jgi:hypothetical protein
MYFILGRWFKLGHELVASLAEKFEQFELFGLVLAQGTNAEKLTLNFQFVSDL